ncbi:MAG: Gx transporter family protein [Saccharofermentanales bacterium]
MEKTMKFTKNKMPVSRRIAFCAIFTALALVLSIVENYFPIGLLIPVPGIKLGLANIVTVFAIVTLTPVDTIIIIVIRCLIMGSITGPVSFLFSITGALLAFIVMMILVKGLGSVFSVVGISMGGAVAHNIGQIAAAVFVMKDAGLIFSYLPFLMLIALFTGALTGFAAIPVIKNTEKTLMKYMGKDKIA